jgi:epoxyqueuosine reductase
MEEMTDNPPGLTRDLVRALAREAGFADAGLVALPYAEEARDAARLRGWLNAGRSGTMRYLARAADDGQPLRGRANLPFPWTRSALICFASYHSAAPLSTAAHSQKCGWIARYAWSSRTDQSGQRRPSDYHKVLLRRLRQLESSLHARLGEFESRAFVDTGPVMERALATAAGLGWTGKNTCLIHPELGSFGFLAVLLTSLEARPEDEITPKTGRCGRCTRCIDACPTGALVAPHQMDATRCIAYLTIEHKGPIAPELAARMGRQLFGCDICQEVCPWNAPHRAPEASDAELEPRPELVNPGLDWLASLDEQAFEQLFNGSPVRRAGFLGLRRNLAIAMGNSGLDGFAPRLKAWADAADEGLRSAALWALDKLRSSCKSTIL